MKKYIFLILFILIVTKLVGQVKNIKRIETTCSLKDNNALIPLAKHGFALIFCHNKLICYDLNLNKKGSVKLVTNDNYIISESFGVDSLVYLFSIKGRSGFKVDVINTSSLLLEKTFYGGPDPGFTARFNSFKVSKNSIIVEGNYFLYRIDMLTGKQTKLYMFGEGEIDKYSLNYNTDELFVFFNKKAKKRKKEMTIIEYSNVGKKIHTFKLNKNTDYTITNINVTKSGYGVLFFTGTYYSSLSKNKKTKFSAGTTAYEKYKSEGLFMAKAIRDSVVFVKYYNFLKFDDFLPDLSDDKMARIEKRIEKNEISGKELAFSFNIVSHEIIETKDGNIFIGESFYPVYTNYYDGSKNVKRFEGYQYTHGLVAKFNFEGEKIWDKSFKLNVFIEEPELKRIITVKRSYDEETIRLLYSNNGIIYSKKISMDKFNVVENKSNFVSVNAQTEGIKKDLSKIKYWYDQYFISYGNQVLKDADQPLGKKRMKASYVAKVSVN